MQALTKSPFPLNSTITTRKFRGRSLGASFVLGTLLLFPTTERLQASNSFEGETGSWHNQSLWSTGQVPTEEDYVFIGGFTPTVATISEGDAVSASAYIANSNGENGSVIVENGRTWTVGNSLNVSYSGTGSLLVRDGGTVSSYYSTIARDTSGSGTATITGSGSLWQAGYLLTVGGDGDGTLLVENGGMVTASQGSIGERGTGEAVVTGTGSTWENSGTFIVGEMATGTLKVENGGKVSSGDLSWASAFIGIAHESTGVATISGPGSLWETKSNLYVGYAGNGMLTVENGGKVTTSFSGSIGSVDDNDAEKIGEGKATITGSSSSWTIDFDLNVGDTGVGALNVEAGGSVVSSSGFVGTQAGASGTSTVSGSNSLWSTDNLSIGHRGEGTLSVKEGGRVTVTLGDTYIAANGGSKGVVTVTGAGSRMENRAVMWVGSNGDGTLNVANGAVVTATNVRISFGSESKGTINLTGNTEGRGVLLTTYVKREGTDATLNFDGGILRARRANADFLESFAAGDVLIHNGGAFIDTNGYNITIATDLQNATGQTGGLTKQGTGRLTLTGTSTYSGVTSVEAGVFRATGRLSGGVAIKNSGTLDGTGTVGAVTVEAGGIIAPGNSVGKLSTGSQTWNGGGSYLWEITSATGTPGANWDLLDVNGMLTLNSTTANPFTIAMKGSLSGLDVASEYSWIILTASGGFNESFNPNKLTLNVTEFSGKPEGMTFFLDTEENNLVLKLSAVPEPGQLVLVITGLGAAFLVARQKSKLLS